MRKRRPQRLTKACRTACVIALAASFALPASVPAHAAVFNPQYLISDEEMRDAGAMSYFDIYSFLEDKGDLNTVFVESPDLCTVGKPEGYDPARESVPMVKGVAQMIYDAANCYSVNPKYIITLLEKEMSLVTWNSSRSDWQKRLDWAAGYALCDGCDKTDPLAQKYKGIDRQIDVAAGWMDWYFKNYSRYSAYAWPGVTKVISGMEITPANTATAALYTYTPHVGNGRVGGNRLFWNIWTRWFGGGGSMQYPDGTLLRDDKTGAVILMQNGKARPILNESVLRSRFNENAIIDLDSFDFSDLLAAKQGPPIAFPDIALVRTEEGDRYLLVRDIKRWIPDDATFAAMGFNPEELEDVKAADLEGYTDGPFLVVGETYPTGQLLQDAVTGGVFYVEAGVKHALWDKAVLQTRFPGKRIVPMSPEDLAALPTAEPVPLPDGTLVKTPDSATVYVIANGQRHSIPSETVFLAYGYKWSTIVTASAKVLTLTPLGEPLLLVDDSMAAETTEI